MSLNVKKSNFLHIHYGRSEKKKLQIQINETLVEETETTKYLGTFIDNKLTWKTQIQHIKLERSEDAELATENTVGRRKN